MKFSLRTMLLGVAAIALVAALAHYVVNYEARDVYIDVHGPACTVYLDDRPIGKTPIEVSYRQFKAWCRDYELAADGPDPSPVFGGTVLVGVKRKDGTNALLWVAPQEGYRVIETPFGSAALVEGDFRLGKRDVEYTKNKRGRDRLRCEWKLVRASHNDIELEVAFTEALPLGQVTVSAPGDLETALTAQDLEVHLPIASTTPGYDTLHTPLLTATDWRPDTGRLVAVVSLPKLKPGFYWMPGYLYYPNADRRFMIDNRESYIVPTAFRIPEPAESK
jgi:hypothetical protein